MDLFCFSLLVLVLVAVVVKILVAGVMEVVIAGYLNRRSEAFLESFSICENNLEKFFNPKYRSIAFNIQFEVFNDSGGSVSIFMIIEL
jgi:hypothetical protein